MTTTYRNSMLVVDEFVGDHLTHMLIDSGIWIGYLHTVRGYLEGNLREVCVISIQFHWT